MSAELVMIPNVSEPTAADECVRIAARTRAAVDRALAPSRAAAKVQAKFGASQAAAKIQAKFGASRAAESRARFGVRDSFAAAAVAGAKSLRRTLLGPVEPPLRDAPVPDPSSHGPEGPAYQADTGSPESRAALLLAAPRAPSRNGLAAVA